MLLLKLACGETAPLGPAADRARTEALRLLREPEIRRDLASEPQLLDRVKTMMQSMAA